MREMSGRAEKQQRQMQMQEGEPMTNRVQFNDDGTLDEVVTDGGAHLEHMGGRGWFLSMQRKDGSEYCVWFTGKITYQEEREAGEYKEPQPEPLTRIQNILVPVIVVFVIVGAGWVLAHAVLAIWQAVM